MLLFADHPAISVLAWSGIKAHCDVIRCVIQKSCPVKSKYFSFFHQSNL